MIIKFCETYYIRDVSILKDEYTLTKQPSMAKILTEASAKRYCKWLNYNRVTQVVTEGFYIDG